MGRVALAVVFLKYQCHNIFEKEHRLLHWDTLDNILKGQGRDQASVLFYQLCQVSSARNLGLAILHMPLPHSQLHLISHRLPLILFPKSVILSTCLHIRIIGGSFKNSKGQATSHINGITSSFWSSPSDSNVQTSLETTVLKIFQIWLLSIPIPMVPVTSHLDDCTHQLPTWSWCF